MKKIITRFVYATSFLFSLVCKEQLNAQAVVNLLDYVKIGSNHGIPIISQGCGFGWDCDTLGDLNGDGNKDIVVGAPYALVNGHQYSGEIYILFLNQNKTVKATKIISRNSGNLTLQTGTSYDLVGCTVCNIGDFNHDGTNDLAIGSENNNMVYLLMLDTNGTVKTTTSISIGNFGYLGSDIINLGDIDNDGITDIAISGYSNGIYIVKLNVNGSVKSSSLLVSNTAMGYGGNDNFPTVTRIIGDLDGDGMNELVTSAPGYNNAKGEVIILFLNSNYTLKSYSKISSGSSNFAILQNNDLFGCEIQNAGDLNGDGRQDIYVGAIGDDNGGSSSLNYGAVYAICLNATGTVKSYTKLGKNYGLLSDILNPGDCFGLGICNLGDINGDSKNDLFISSYKEDEGGIDNGTAYFFTTQSTVSIEKENENKINLQIYPNPVDGYLNISIDIKIDNIKIFDSNGKLITNIENPLTQNGNLSIDVNSYPVGLYLISCRSKDLLFNGRFVKQ